MTIVFLIILLTGANGKTMTHEVTARYFNVPTQEIDFNDVKQVPLFPILEQSYEDLLSEVLENIDGSHIFDKEDPSNS